METKIFKSYSDFLTRPDKKVNEVSERFAKDNPNYQLDNVTNLGCRSCSYCSYCSDCRSCSDFKKNPQRIVSPILGSRNSQSTYYWTEKDRDIVVCGCFKGDLAEFKKAVNETHGNRKHGKNYKKWIKGIEAYLNAIH